MNAREAQSLLRTIGRAGTQEEYAQARAITAALFTQWEARKALLAHRRRKPELLDDAWDAWHTEHTRLALELSKAEAALIALEDAQP